MLRMYMNQTIKMKLGTFVFATFIKKERSHKWMIFLQLNISQFEREIMEREREENGGWPDYLQELGSDHAFFLVAKIGNWFWRWVMDII